MSEKINLMPTSPDEKPKAIPAGWSELASGLVVPEGVAKSDAEAVK